MPADQGCGLDNQKSGSPIKEARPEDQPESSRVRQPPWPNFALLVERQLLAKEQILGNQSCSRTETQPNEARDIDCQTSKDVKCRPDQPEEASSIQLSIVMPPRSNLHAAASASVFSTSKYFCGAQVANPYITPILRFCPVCR